MPGKKHSAIDPEGIGWYHHRPEDLRGESIPITPSDQLRSDPEPDAGVRTPKPQVDSHPLGSQPRDIVSNSVGFDPESRVRFPDHDIRLVFVG